MSPTDRLEAAFRAHYREIAAYCLRRCASREDAEEAATEVFATAWRRIASLPAEPETLLWLYGVARRVVANQRRAARRHERLGARLRERATAGGDAASPARPGGIPEFSGVAGAALAGLSAGDRELLLLSAWEELTPAEIARVLGVPAPVVSARLYRARRRFAAALGPLVPTGDPS